MKYNFNKQIDRQETSSLKWDWYKGKDIIPLWVADMDFPSSEEIIRSLHSRIDHGIFGYTLPPDEIFDVIIAHMKKKYRWDIKREWIIFVPGVVSGLNITCRSVGGDGEDVLVPTPIYPPFLKAPSLSEKNIITIEMVEENGRLTFDFDRLEKQITNKTCLFLLCSPQNPGGTVFTELELKKIFDICESNNIIICSDEIHCGLILDKDKSHRPTASVEGIDGNRVITLMAPSKTYNIPGLGCSFAVISDHTLRKNFKKASAGIVPEVTLTGYTAAIAAYRDSDIWHKEVLDYLRANRDLVSSYIEKIPGLRMLYPESTYLAWIDTRALPLENPVKFFEEAGVGLANGQYFGAPSFVRLNFGCSRDLLEKALVRIETAVMRLQTGKIP